MILGRREFLSSLVFAAVSTGATAGPSYAAVKPSAPPDGYGPLVRDPNGVLDLPVGFSYTIISRKGDVMDDGFYVPGSCDGMGVFAGANGRLIIVRNHELSPGAGVITPFGVNYERLDRYDRSLFYDAGTGANPSPGCTTFIVYDPIQQTVVEQSLGIAGTLRNCNGGKTPWDTWISCEETEQRAVAPYAKDHGYCFEVDPYTRQRRTTPVPLVGLGRFPHESVAVLPNGIVYETEDHTNGLIYRFLPDVPGDLTAGGRLQALRITDHPSVITNNWGPTRTIPVGEEFAVDWIDLEAVESPNTVLREQGFANGAARFTRGEGMTRNKRAVFFAATDGGVLRRGQLWKYTPSPYEGTRYEWRSPGRIKLILEPNDWNVVDNIDNVIVAPWGHKIFCEDGAGEDYIKGIGPGHTVYPIARNALSIDEMTGPAFSPDGTTLFVGIQAVGYTLAITGPWTS